MTSGITTVGNWSAITEHRLRLAMEASKRAGRRTGQGVTIQAVVHMAKSAGALTPPGERTRPVVKNIEFRHLLRKAEYKRRAMMDRWLNNGNERAYFKFTATKWMQAPKVAKALYANDKKQIGKIRRRGTARDSWKWGMRALNARFGEAKNREIPGVVTASTTHNGVLGEGGEVRTVMENRLKYVLKILPSGWEETVAVKATNVILKVAGIELERRSAREMEKAFSSGVAA